jgi:small subunit ribosomal protein S6
MALGAGRFLLYHFKYPAASSRGWGFSMRCYEITFVTRHDLVQTELQKLIDQLVQVVESEGGKVAKIEPWGVRPLAYPIKKQKKGMYTLLGVAMPQSCLPALQHILRYNEEVLRSLVVGVPAISEAPSAILTARGDDEAA